MVRWRDDSVSPPHSITGLKLKLGDCKTVSSVTALHRTTGCCRLLAGARSRDVLGMITLTGWIFKWPVGSQCVVWGGCRAYWAQLTCPARQPEPPQRSPPPPLQSRQHQDSREGGREGGREENTSQAYCYGGSRTGQIVSQF